MGNFRTQSQFIEALQTGEDFERTVAEFIVMNLNADVEKIGSLETDEIQKPLMWRRSDTVLRKHTAADLRICKRIGEQRIAYDAQVKLKNFIVNRGSVTGRQGFYFDVREHTRLSRLNQTRPCILIIGCEQLPKLCQYHPELPRFRTPFIYVPQDALEPGQCKLHRRNVEGKDTFVIPLTKFRPLGELYDDHRNPEPANRNTPPTTAAGRETNIDGNPNSI